MLFKNTYIYLYTFKFRTPQDQNSAFHGIGASVSGADRQPFSCHSLSVFAWEKFSCYGLARKVFSIEGLV